MAKHFISVLGTGNYSDTAYGEEDNFVRTPYIQLALLKLKVGQLSKEDRITVFVTDGERGSRKVNWIPEDKEGLRAQLIKEGYGVFLNPEDDIIPIGANEDELFEIFQTIYASIGEGEELYLDITHSLRNIPIQLLAVIQYARVMKNVTVAGIYYGAYEVRQEREDGSVIAPIFNLKPFVEIMDWTSAADSFIRYGNSSQMNDLIKARTKEENAYKRKDISEEERSRLKTDTIQPKMLSKVGKDLEELTRALETSRGFHPSSEIPVATKYRESGYSIKGSYENYKKSYDSLMFEMEKNESNREEQKVAVRQPLRPLLEKVNEKVRVFDCKSNLEIGLAAVDWDIKNHLVQQGFTALEETIKTYLCNYAGLDESKEIFRDDVCKLLCNKHSRLYQKEEPIDDPAIAAYDDWKKSFIEDHGDEAEEIIKKHEPAIKKLSALIAGEFSVLTKNISNERNALNHFGYSNIGQFSAKKLEDELKKNAMLFRKLIEKEKQ